MPRTREPFYEPPTNGAAMKRARREQGLEEEIALLRVKLKQFVEQDEPDEGLILSAVNTLGRALMAQARLRGAAPAEVRVRLRAVMRQLGTYVKEGVDERTAVSDEPSAVSHQPSAAGARPPAERSGGIDAPGG
jgi:hypothetical protein